MIGSAERVCASAGRDTLGSHGDTNRGGPPATYAKLPSCLARRHIRSVAAQVADRPRNEEHHALATPVASHWRYTSSTSVA